MKSWLLNGCGFTIEIGNEVERQLGHREMGRHRLSCCPQQDVRSARRSS